MAEVSELLRAERLSLIELLETLTPEEWATPSLCGAWTVQEVAAHLAGTPALPARKAPKELLRSGVLPNKAIARMAVRWARWGTDSILGQLRVNAERGAKPIGLPKEAALVDAVVHGLDIRRPLGRTRPVPAEAFKIVADFGLKARFPATAVVGGNPRKRVRGLRLVAKDADWTHGTGSEVRASAETLLLVLYGRPIRWGELAGPGAAQLYARV